MGIEGKKIVLVTGCSPGGIGNSLCREFHEKGCHVIATARNVAVLKDLEAMGMTTMTMDVTDEDSIARCKAAVEELTGGQLDILVNNAGMNYTVPIMDVTMSESRRIFDTNFIGLIAVTQAFARMLIAAPGGLVLNIGSISGVMPFVFGGVYNASKAAVHSLSHCLRLELEPYGVRVMVVVTGGIQSNIARVDHQLPPDSLYQPINAEYKERIKRSQVGAMHPDVYARGVVAQALKKRPPHWYWRGANVWLVWFASKVFGSFIFDRIFPRMFGLSKLAAWVKKQKKTA